MQSDFIVYKCLWRKHTSNSKSNYKLGLGWGGCVGGGWGRNTSDMIGIGEVIIKTPDVSLPLLTSPHHKYYDNWYCTGYQCSRQEKERDILHFKHSTQHWYHTHNNLNNKYSALSVYTQYFSHFFCFVFQFWAHFILSLYFQCCQFFYFYFFLFFRKM